MADSELPITVVIITQAIYIGWSDFIALWSQHDCHVV